MRVIFAGTPVFAVAPLQSILRAGHDVALVLTQPDRPAGRGLAQTGSVVKQHAVQLGLTVLQPQSLKDVTIHGVLLEVSADIMVVVAYGLIIPKRVLAIPRLGAINIHASLLPRWRGAAPIQRAIAAGDAETGVTIMQMDPGLDTGPVLLRRAMAIAPTDTAGSVHDRLAALGAELVVDALAGLEAGRLSATPQPSEGVTYAAKVAKAESWLDWRKTARELERLIRALNPTPGATARIAGSDFKIWQATLIDDQTDLNHPGAVKAVSSAGLVVACGAGALRLEIMQRAGSKRLHVSELLRGLRIEPGMRFAATPAN
jgi:methionyl-tRNA formyltransferase